MNIDKTIEAIEQDCPPGNDVRIQQPDGYIEDSWSIDISTDDLRELVRQRNALLAAVKEINNVGYPVPELDALIRDCEGREPIEQSKHF